VKQTNRYKAWNSFLCLNLVYECFNPYSQVKYLTEVLFWQVCENDILVVDVVNRVPGHGLAVHWRGVPQKDTPFMDGVPMVTQCPIPSYTTFQYKFRAARPGTHLWHAHNGKFSFKK